MPLYHITINKSLSKPERMQVHAILLSLGGVSFFDPQYSGPTVTAFVLDTHRRGDWFEEKIQGGIAKFFAQEVKVDVRSIH